MTAHNRRMTPPEARVRLEQLPQMLAAERDRRGLSQRKAAAEMRLCNSTVARVELGHWPDVAAFLAICAWLRLPPGWFVDNAPDGTGVAPMDAYRRGWDDCAATVRSALDINNPPEKRRP